MFLIDSYGSFGNGSFGNGSFGNGPQRRKKLSTVEGIHFCVYKNGHAKLLQFLYKQLHPFSLSEGLQFFLK